MEGKPHAIILGGTSGLGLELARTCLARGITPIVLGRTAESEDLNGALEGMVRMPLDLRDLDEVKIDHDLLDHPSFSNVTHVFWVAGMRQEVPFLDMDPHELLDLTTTNFVGPMLFLNIVLRELLRRSVSFKLVVVASTSAFKKRSGEEAYCATNAAKATFAAQMAGTFDRVSPGSSVLLVMPGGMKSGFWIGADVDTSSFMEPVAVAQVIDQEVFINAGMEGLCENFRSFAIERESDGSPRIVYRDLKSNIF